MNKIEFIKPHNRYRIITMYPVNPYMFSGWPEQTARYSTYFNLSAESGVIKDKYNIPIAVSNNVSVTDVDGIRSMSFNGTSSYLKITSMPLVTSVDGFWMNILFQANVVNVTQGLCGKTLAGASNNRYGMLILATNNAAFNVDGGLPTKASAATGVKVFTMTFKNSTLRTYVDGILNTSNGVTYGSDTLANYWIGAYGDATNANPSSFFNGKIYNVMQGSGEPNATDISELYKYTKARFRL